VCAQQRGLRHPIDLLFHTLAAQEGKPAIAVILSGTGDDGTEGAKGNRSQDINAREQSKQGQVFSL